MGKNFMSVFKMRTIGCLVFLCSMMLICAVRLVAICRDESLADAKINTLTVELENTRGAVLDCNGKELLLMKRCYAVVFTPCEQAMLRFVSETDGNERAHGLECLRNNKPVVIERKNKISGIGVYSYEIFNRNLDDISLEHLIGYLNGENHGVFGLEKAFDDILFCSQGAEASFSITAAGDIIVGNEPIFTSRKTPGYVKLTIDKKIQSVCSIAAEKLSKGAIVITEANTGEVKAMVSKPGFDVNNISKYVSSDSSPFVNRALSAFSVGSVFKPLIAAAMLETGKGDFTHNCTGYSDILGIRFYCNNRNGHGQMNLKTALAVSCNTYFYNGAATVSPRVLNNLAVALGFRGSAKLADGITTVAGTLTTLEQLEKSKAAVANFAIGQGDITLSPLVLCNLYAAIANGGAYCNPAIYKEYGQGEKCYVAQKGYKNMVFSQKTADTIKKYLVNAVENGTGKSAKPITCSAGGKTATAQTGQYVDKKEKLNAWFCGFFPADKPKYIVAILMEGGTSGGTDCGPIFKEIADNINELDIN